MAAGQGFKTFTTGEVLTAADVNGYLMQGVGVFTDAANRDAEITSPQEGQFAYLKDTNVTTYYTGSAWANLDTTGMTNPMTTTGDTIYSSSGSTPARLGIGSTGQVLTVTGGIPSWATPAGGGGMTLIATNLFSGTSTSFSSIPSTYKHLQLQFISIGGAASTAQLTCTFNSSSSSVYSWGSLRWSGGSAASNGTNLDNNLNMFGGQVVPNSTLGTFSGYMDILNYQDTSRYKSGTTVGAGSDASAANNRSWGSTAYTYLSTTTISSIQISANNAMGGLGYVQLWGVA